MFTTKSTSHLIRVIVIIMLGGGSSLQAQVLECRDASGRKTFAQACPAGSKQVKEVQILSSPANTTTNATEKAGVQASSLAEKEQAFKQRQMAKEEAAAKERDRLRALDSECFGLKQKLSSLTGGFPITASKDAEGNPIFMDEAKREEYGKELNEKLKKCP